MVWEREVLDLSNSVVLVGWRFLEESIADSTAVVMLCQLLIELAPVIGLGRVVYGQVWVCWL